MTTRCQQNFISWTFCLNSYCAIQPTLFSDGAFIFVHLYDSLSWYFQRCTKYVTFDKWDSWWYTVTCVHVCLWEKINIYGGIEMERSRRIKSDSTYSSWKTSLWPNLNNIISIFNGHIIRSTRSSCCCEVFEVTLFEWCWISCGKN